MKLNHKTTNKFITHEVLKTSFPHGVEPTRKEYYFSETEFEKYIGMSEREKKGLRQWRRDCSPSPGFLIYVCLYMYFYDESLTQDAASKCFS